MPLPATAARAQGSYTRYTSPIGMFGIVNPNQATVRCTTPNATQSHARLDTQSSYGRGGATLRPAVRPGSFRAAWPAARRAAPPHPPHRLVGYVRDTPSWGVHIGQVDWMGRAPGTLEGSARRARRHSASRSG